MFSLGNEQETSQRAAGGSTNHSLGSSHQSGQTSSFNHYTILGTGLSLEGTILNLGALLILSHQLQYLKPLFFSTSLFGIVLSFLLACLPEPNWTLPNNTRDWVLFTPIVFLLHLLSIFYGFCCIFLQYLQ